MARPRSIPLPSVAAACLCLVLLVGSVGAAGVSAPAATVMWPASGGFLVGEVMTGGAGASDEFLELYNAGGAVLDLNGHELVYVTATGGTVTRKHAWTTQTLVPPGRHVLLANGAGTYAAMADATYSGGLAATGGGLVLRVTGGDPVDGLAWGVAANAFVEGFAGPAPAPGSSLERRPGGELGNATDTNDNLVDTFIQSQPVPQNLAAPATPSTTPTPSDPVPPSASPTVSSPPSPTVTPIITMPPTPAPTATASATDQPTPDPEPTSSPTPSPTSTPGWRPRSTGTPPSPTAGISGR